MKPKHLYEALSPLFFVSLLTGTGPIYSQQTNGKYYLHVSNAFKIVTVLYLIIYTSSLIYGINNEHVARSITYFGNNMSSIGLVLDSLGQIVVVYAIYICSFFTPTSIKNVVDKIAIIDSILQNLGQINNYRKIFWQQIFLFFVGISSIILTALIQIFVLSTYSLFRLSETLWFVYYFPIVIIFIMECQFSFMVFLIYQRFQIINNTLHQMTTENMVDNLESIKDVQIAKAKARESMSSTILQKIETLMQIHDSMVDAANSLNTIYSIQILACMTVLFIKTIFAVFFTYFELFVLGKTQIAANWVIWVMIDGGEILLITITCHLATTQAQKTGAYVHKLLIDPQENDVEDKLMVFSQQVFHQPVEFSACGLFSINAALLFTIIGSSTTYLLIMLQFQEGNEANCIIANATVQ